MQSALSNEKIKNIEFEKDITVTSQVKPLSNVILDGKGKTLTINSISDELNVAADGLYIAQDTVGIEIKNLIVTRTTDTNSDNLIEIYSSAKLENVTAKNGKKTGIYVNNDGEGTITVDFNNITTSGNGWNAGIGLAAQKSSSKVVAKFTGTNSFGENVAVYDEGKTYEGTYEFSGLDGYTQVKIGKQNKWIETTPTVSVELPEGGFVAGVPTEFSITTVANDLAGTKVVGNSTHEFGDKIEKIEYYETKEDSQGWVELPLDMNFGPVEGFPLIDGTSKFKVTFNERAVNAKNLTFKTNIVEQANLENVLAETDATFTVMDRISQ